MKLLKRKKKPLKSGLKLLADAPDEAIEKELDTLPYILVPSSEEMIRGASLWLALLQEDEVLASPLKKDIIREIRALDKYMDKRAHYDSSGVPMFFAYLYYLILWHNTVKYNEDFKRLSEIANLPNIMIDDEKRGYA